MNPRILVAGIGNIFLGDDAFGVEVVHRLLERALPEGVEVGDFGIQGFDLAYEMLENYDANILIDATPRGGTPGTLYVIDPEVNTWENAEQMTPATHGLNPVQVLTMVKQFGGQLRNVRIVGCEPESFGDDEGMMGLSESVATAVPEAISLVEGLIASLQREVREDYEQLEQPIHAAA